MLRTIKTYALLQAVHENIKILLPRFFEIMICLRHETLSYIKHTKSACCYIEDYNACCDIDDYNEVCLYDIIDAIYVHD